MKKNFGRVLAALIAVCVLSMFAHCAAALTIGTFNIEYFHMQGTGGGIAQPPYTGDDMKEVASSILKSGADVLALQEIQGEETMRFFVLKYLPGWKYYGKDIAYKKLGWDNSRENQNHYFLWDPAKVTLLGTPYLHYLKDKFEHAGRRSLIFDRAPMEARFRDNATGREFTLVCVHLKSFSTAGKSDVEAAQRYNIAKRAAQVECLNELSEKLKGPAFILGDYNSPNPRSEVTYPLLTLESGTTFDNWNSSIDYIGYIGIDRARLGTPKETETRIERRSSRRKDHPDHDILTLDVTLD